MTLTGPKRFVTCLKITEAIGPWHCGRSGATRLEKLPRPGRVTCRVKR